MKTWRPEDWERVVSLHYNHRKVLRIKAFEAGADAILDALFKMAKESPTGTFVIDSKEVNVFGGKNEIQ